MAGDSGGLRIPFGRAVAVIVVFLAFVSVIDLRVADVSRTAALARQPDD
jgi:hypothetical protein